MLFFVLSIFTSYEIGLSDVYNNQKTFNKSTGKFVRPILPALSNKIRVYQANYIRKIQPLMIKWKIEADTLKGEEVEVIQDEIQEKFRIRLRSGFKPQRRWRIRDENDTNDNVKERTIFVQGQSIKSLILKTQYPVSDSEPLKVLPTKDKKPLIGEKFRKDMIQTKLKKFRGDILSVQREQTIKDSPKIVLYGKTKKDKAHASSKLKIFVWNQPHWGKTDKTNQKTRCTIGLHITSECEFVTAVNTSEMMLSDAVLFDARMLGFRFSHIAPTLPRSSHQSWILYTNEPHFTGSLSRNFVAEMFNLTASYQPDDDLFVPFGQCHVVPPSSTPAIPNTIHSFSNNSNDKSGLAAWISSKCISQSRRELYVAELRKHLRVDVYGKCGNEKSMARFMCEDFESCRPNLRHYKFYLAFEDVLCDHYLKEVFKVMAAGIYTIPVVLGRGPYEKYLPPNSYLAVNNFTSPLALAEYMMYLDNNVPAYNSYMDWRRKYTCNSLDDHTIPCFICDVLTEKLKNVSNISKKRNRQANCHRATR